MVRSPRRLGDKSAGAGGYRIRGNPETGRRRYRGTEEAGQPVELANRHRRRMRDSRRLETPSPVKPEMQKLGQPGDSSEALRRKWGEGATWSSTKPATRKDARFGATRRSSAGTANGLKIRGNPEIRRRRGRWVRTRGNPETQTLPSRKIRKRGDSRPDRNAERDDA